GTAATTEQKNVRVQIESPGEGWTQDPDTLDTWFSSWLWAYETMDDQTRAKFYPTSVLVTAPDIIFFWVARMIIAGLEFKPGKSESDKDNIPFRHVYFTGLIRDKQGRKMSKSLGNSPDPLELIDKYGADGLRFGLMRIAPSGQDIRYDEKQIEEGRNFVTKLWNVARLRQMHGSSPAEPQIDYRQLSIYAKEVLARLRERFDSICSTAKAGGAGRCRSCKQEETGRGDLCDGAGRPEPARGSQNSVEPESAIHLARGQRGNHARDANDGPITQFRGIEIRPTIQAGTGRSGGADSAGRTFSRYWRRGQSS